MEGKEGGGGGVCQSLENQGSSMLPSLGKPLLALVVASKGKGCWWFGNGLGMVWVC